MGMTFKEPLSTSKFLADDASYLERIREQYTNKFNLNWRPGRRQRFCDDQLAILLEYFERDPDWDFQKKIEIGFKISLNAAQVKKWNYDER